MRIEKVIEGGVTYYVHYYKNNDIKWHILVKNKKSKRKVPHRIFGPAEIRSDGTLLWFQFGKLHRYGGPAVIHPNGTLKYFIDNKIHRLNGPAFIAENGIKAWYLNNKEIFVSSQKEFEIYIKTLSIS